MEKEGFPQCEGIREVLEKLHQEGYLLAVGSSSPEDVIQKVLKDLELGQYFSAFMSVENMYILSRHRIRFLPQQKHYYWILPHVW